MYPSSAADDPIHGIFDLSDRAATVAPRLLWMSRVTSLAVLATSVVVGYLLFTTLLDSRLTLILGLLAVAGGGASLLLLRENERLYREYVERHRTLLRLQEADPSPPIPQGTGPAERLLTHLRETNPRIEQALREDPRAARFRVQAHIHGALRRLDLLLLSHPRGRLGHREPGFAVIARVADGAVEPSTVEQFASEVEAFAPRLGEPLARAILLSPKGGSVADSAYETAKAHSLRIGRRKIPVEIVSERADGTYDLVPLLVEAP